MGFLRVFFLIFLSEKCIVCDNVVQQCDVIRDIIYVIDYYMYKFEKKNWSNIIEKHFTTWPFVFILPACDRYKQYQPRLLH